jgi:prophage maintenance system killer protein
MVPEYILTAIISILGSVMVVLLGVILSRLARLESKLDNKQDKTECDRQSDRCQKLFSFDDFWDVFTKHSHTGLEPNSRVTR